MKDAETEKNPIVFQFEWIPWIPFQNHKKFDFGEDDSSIKGGALGLKLQNLEQNLATGLKVSEGGNLEKYDPDMEDILGALLDENIGSDDTSLSEEDKLRLLLLFSQTEKGSKFNQPSFTIESSPLTKCSKLHFSRK